MKGMRSSAVRDRLLRFGVAHRDRSMDLVSYDIAGSDGSTAYAVSVWIFGRTVRTEVDGGEKEYHYPGFLEKPGVVWVGQSVFLLTPERSREFQDYLNGKGVSYGRLKVRIE
ncbi:MAG: hypothetical protein A3K65_06945 [Euryarchaeota archaeon RBG_16_68_12]|nr:MAG: hypothetical protein A3K65_06945 [Euryarchaeota archaeon RBG_16_68_12]